MIAEYLENIQISHNKISLPKNKTKPEKMSDPHVTTSYSTFCCDTCFNKIDVNHKNTDQTDGLQE